MNSLSINYPLSPIAQEYVAQQHKNSVKRRRELTCSSIELNNLLYDYELLVSDALLDFEDKIAGISLSAQKPEDLIEAVKIIQQLDNQHLLKIWEQANNLQDAKGLQLLQNSSVPFELFQGAAPGHYDFIVDGETGEKFYQPSCYPTQMK